VGDAVTPAEPRWLTEVRLRSARRVLWLRHLWSQHRYADEHMLAISHSEVDRALLPDRELTAAEQAFYASDDRATDLTAQIAALSGQPADDRLAHLTATLGLSPTDTALFTLTLASAADQRIARVFGYLLDQPEAADPTPALAMALFGLPGQPPGQDSSLIRWLLAEPVRSSGDAFAWTTGWRADGTLLPTLLCPAAADGPASWPGGSLGQVVDPPQGPVLRPAAVAQIAAFVQALRQDGGSVLPIEIELAGPPGSGRTTLAAQAMAALDGRLMAVDGAAVAARPDPYAVALREARRARLDGSVLAWEHADRLPPMLLESLPPAPLTFLSVPAAGNVITRARSVKWSVNCAPIGSAERTAMWTALASTPPPAAVTDWALRPAEVMVAASVAAAGEQAVGEVCRRLLTAATPELLTALPLPFTWPDLVLPADTAEHLCEFQGQAAGRRVVLDDWGFSRLTPSGRSVTALLAGPPGTGKTMAAQVIARSLGLDLYRVDLAEVVSKYIGETEKHLSEVFDACERAPVMLLFDEADALFGKRTQVSDAHDRYANIEIDYILQRMEQFDGIAVLTTNRKGDLDTAFVRRLRFIIDFAPPDAAERERLWRIALDGAADRRQRPLVGKLDWAGLAGILDLTAADIKSAALAAAFLAHGDGGLITERHVLAATRRELAKQGVVVRPGQLEHR
jgi:hypothetical protein